MTTSVVVADLVVSLARYGDTRSAEKRKQARVLVVSGDLGFLLIFIVLPTVLIVSGFWLLLFLRRDSTLRSSVQPEVDRTDTAESTDSLIEDRTIEPVAVIAVSESLLHANEEDGDEAVSSPTEIQEMSLEASSSNGEDELDPNDQGREEEEEAGPSRLLEDTVAPPEIADLYAESEPRTVSTEEASAHTGMTEDIIPVSPAQAQSGMDAATDEPGEYASPEEELIDDQSGQTTPLPDQTAPAPLSSEEEDEASNAQVESEEEQVNQRRQPSARLVRSTENVARRGRASARKVPPIVRTGVRDEDSVERKDGS